MRSSAAAVIALIVSVSGLAIKNFDRRDRGTLCAYVGEYCDTEQSQCCQKKLGRAFCENNVVTFGSCNQSCSQDDININALCDAL
jgi:hypothetical protein